jgi:hypothetical protein
MTTRFTSSIVATLLACTPALAKDPMTKYDDAVKLLAAPKTWCDGARQLATLKDKKALIPLMHAFESPSEADKQCLADAMETLGGEAEVRTLLASRTAGDRAVGIHLAVLFASDEQLAPLENVAQHDADAALRDKARNALAQQKQTAKWEQLIAGYLAETDDTLRGWAIDLLIRHNGASSWKRVEDHLANEKNAELRAKIQSALANRKKP